MKKLVDKQEIKKALEIRDLTDPSQGESCMQKIVSEIKNNLLLLPEWSNVKTKEIRRNPIVSVEDNYDKLLYPDDGIAREERYTRYVSEKRILRTQMSAVIPKSLEELNKENKNADTLLACPGVVYRRDVIDRTHVGEPHQLDLWRISKSKKLTVESLDQMIESVVQSVLPDSDWRTIPAHHNYTVKGKEIQVRTAEGWLELGECGLANPKVLENAGLTGYAGLAMGIGLDRAVMLRKNITDIRLLRSEDPRVVNQMNTLEIYKPVSNQPTAERDISVAVDKNYSEEEVSDIIRQRVENHELNLIEKLKIVSTYDYADLPSTAIGRLGMAKNQKNILIKITLRHPTLSIKREEANELIDKIYKIIHEGRCKGYGK